MQCLFDTNALVFPFCLFKNWSTVPALPSVTTVSPGPVLVDIENLPRSPGTSPQDKKWCVTCGISLLYFGRSKLYFGRSNYYRSLQIVYHSFSQAHLSYMCLWKSINLIFGFLA